MFRAKKSLGERESYSTKTNLLPKKLAVKDLDGFLLFLIRNEQGSTLDFTLLDYSAMYDLVFVLVAWLNREMQIREGSLRRNTHEQITIGDVANFFTVGSDKIKKGIEKGKILKPQKNEKGNRYWETTDLILVLTQTKEFLNDGENG